MAKSFKEIKDEIEYLTTSKDVWETDLSLNLMRKKLKEVLNDLNEYNQNIENYISSEIQRILKTDIPKLISDSKTQQTNELEPRLSNIELNIKTLYSNDIVLQKFANDLTNGDLQIKQIIGSA